MKYPKEYLDEIKIRLKVSTVVSKHVSLKKRGKEFVGLSPFKNEKTPSFTVNDEKGFYHCFSTSEHGNIFDFLMKMQNLKFGEAVKFLANLAGMTPYRFSKVDEQREKEWNEYTGIYSNYTEYYHNELLNNPNSKIALDYLKKRKIDNSIIKEFKIGFVNFNSNIYEKLNKNYDVKILNESGLFFYDENKKIYVERFRNRVIFPINSLSGKPMAFGGRTIDTKNKYAKYINSPETNFFRKGNNLYNLDKVRKISHKFDEVFLVEGYMDVIGLSKFKIENCIANLGTALTDKQIYMVTQFFDNIVICFDGDESGYKAAIRAAENSIKSVLPDKQIYFLFLPDGEDPDTFVEKKGKNQFLDFYKNNKIPVHKLIFEHYKKDNSSSPSALASLEKKLKSLANSVKDNMVRKYILGYFLESLAKHSPGTVFKNSNKSFIGFNKPLDKTKKLLKDTENFSSIDIKEFCIIYIIINNLNFFYQRPDLLENIKFYKKENGIIFDQILNCVKDGNLDNLKVDSQLLDQIEKYANIKHIVRKNDKDESKIVEIFNDIKNELKTHNLELRIQELESKFAEDFNQNTFDEINRLKKEQNIN
ncbi:DNA primase [Candidatus Pelagibacter sp.]|nr:DNA primase [Candidatus Pelagibacter sp.]